MTNIFELSSRILELNIVKADTFRRIGNFTAASSLIFLLIVSVVVPVNIAFSSQTAEGEQFPQSIIAASGTDTTPHALELRAVQDEDNAEPRKVSGFRLDMTNVVAAQINSQVLVFVTDSSVRVLEAKVRTVSDQLIDLVPSSQANAFSLANLPVGVYTLDVITQRGNTKAAYEGILVISQQPTTIINETTKNVINQEINQNTRVDIDGDDDEECPPGQSGTPPNCYLQCPNAEGCPPPPICIDPSCAPTECPDGRIVPPGQSCDDEETPPEDGGNVGDEDDTGGGDEEDEGDQGDQGDQGDEDDTVGGDGENGGEGQEELPLPIFGGPGGG